MNHLLKVAAVVAVVAVAAPAWAQTAEQLNAQQLNQLNAGAAVPQAYPQAVNPARLPRMLRTQHNLPNASRPWIVFDGGCLDSANSRS